MSKPPFQYYIGIDPISANKSSGAYCVGKMNIDGFEVISCGKIFNSKYAWLNRTVFRLKMLWFKIKYPNHIVCTEKNKSFRHVERQRNYNNYARLLKQYPLTPDDVWKN